MHFRPKPAGAGTGNGKKPLIKKASPGASKKKPLNYQIRSLERLLRLVSDAAVWSRETRGRR
jgi:hypothetical protein